MNDTMRAAADFLLSHDNYDILTHDYPDGDTLGSGYALCRVLRQLGKNARVITTRLPKDFVFLAQGLEEQSFDTQTVVSVDVADEKLLGSNREKYLGKIDLCIDHHEINRVDAPLKCVDPHASSNCEILFELFAEMGVPIDADTAACIYTGVATDTGCFKYSNTTSKTLRIAAELLDLGGIQFSDLLRRRPLRDHRGNSGYDEKGRGERRRARGSRVDPAPDRGR